MAAVHQKVKYKMKRWTDVLWIKLLLTFLSATLFVPLVCFATYLICDPPNISLAHIQWWWPHVGLWYGLVGGICGAWVTLLTYLKEKRHSKPDDYDLTS